MEGKISYSEISNLLGKFRTLANECSSNNAQAKNAVINFSQSALKLDIGSYTDDLVYKMNGSADLLQEDYTRIINFLDNLVEKASAAHDKSVSLIEATDSWKATDTISRG